MSKGIGIQGLNLIKSFEGCRLTAYRAIPSETYFTIGWGHYGADVEEGEIITQAQADSMLINDLGRYVGYVNNVDYCPQTSKLNQAQFDALVSFCYNCGGGCLSQLCHDNTSLSEIVEDMLNYTHAGGQVLAGLVRRRKEEYNLFMSMGENEEEKYSSEDNGGSCEVVLPKLSKGSNSGYVKTLQILLNKYNDAGLDEDGGFGQLTYNAVIEYQRSRSLDVDGVVGTQTWGQLFK